MVALPNPSFQPKTHRWRRGAGGGGGGLSRRYHPNTVHFVPYNSLFLDQNGETVHKVPVRLDFLVTNSLLLPSNFTICPSNSPKMGKNGPECAQLVSNSPKTKNGPYVGLRGSDPNSEGT